MSEHDYEAVALIKVQRCKQTGKYGAITEFEVHREGDAGFDTVGNLLVVVGENIARELRSRPTQPDLTPTVLPAPEPIDPHSEPRAFVS
jgi:hypothetical protein